MSSIIKVIYVRCFKQKSRGFKYMITKYSRDFKQKRKRENASKSYGNQDEHKINKFVKNHRRINGNVFFNLKKFVSINRTYLCIHRYSSKKVTILPSPLNPHLFPSFFLSFSFNFFNNALLIYFII